MTLPALSGDQDNYLFVESGVASLGTFKQHVTSNSLFTLDYSEYLATGESLASVAYSMLPATTPPLAVSASNLLPVDGVANQAASFLLGGGVEGNVYTVSVTATTSLGQTKVDTFKLNVTTEGKSCGYPIGCCDPCGSTSNSAGSGANEGSFSWLATRVNVSTSIIAVAPQRPGRHAVTIANVGNVYCEISHAPVFNIGDGTPLGAGAAVTLDTQAIVYGRALTTGGDVSVMETY